MVTSVEIRKSLPVPSCTRFKLGIREWDGIDKPEFISKCEINLDEMSALVHAGIASIPTGMDNSDLTDKIDPKSIISVEMNIIHNRPRLQLYINLPKLSWYRSGPTVFIDPTILHNEIRYSKHWMQFCATGFSADELIEKSSWPDNPTEMVDKW